MWPKGNTINDAVVIGEKEGRLYKFKGHPEQALVHDTVEPNELWHRSLAHVHYRVLPLASKATQRLLEIQAKHDEVWKGCAKGKNIDDAIVIGEQEGGFYKLKGHPEQALVHDTVEPNELWHRRLAHVHYRVLSSDCTPAAEI